MHELTLPDKTPLKNAAKYRAQMSWVIAIGLTLSGLLLSTQHCVAQSTLTAVNPIAASSSINGGTTQALPLPGAFPALEWKALTPAQQISLKPLAESWRNLSDPQKRKWISLTANFSRMSTTDQARLHERMVQWAALSAKQREQARLNFAEIKKVESQQKNEKWQAYQALSAEEKQKLAKSAQPKPPRTAIAAKPATSSQLNLVPVKKIGGHLSLATSAPVSASSRPTPARPAPPTLPISPATSVQNAASKP